MARSADWKSAIQQVRNLRYPLAVATILLFLHASAQAQQKCIVLKSFGYPAEAGVEPRAGVVEHQGLLYGTTFSGGAMGRGTVFMLSGDGRAFQVLHSFRGGDGGGYNPEGMLIIGEDGALYGTASGGGIAESGILFKLNRDGTGYKVLHRLDPSTDGRDSRAGLLEGSDGLLYGVTSTGGPHAGGTIFSVKPNGQSFKVLYAFKLGSREGKTPLGDLIEEDGVLYGTTVGGGIAESGVVFKMNTDGTGYKVLHHFNPSGNDGRNPTARLCASKGALYGTTSGGGLYQGGTVFSVKMDGSNYKTLYNFNTDGRGPVGGLIRQQNGDLYGLAAVGGAFGGGAMFRLTTEGKYSVVHSFGAVGLTIESNDGREPVPGLTQGEDGAIYGATAAGGAFALGTVFRLD